MDNPASQMPLIKSPRPAARGFEAPQRPLEIQLAEIWEDLFGTTPIGVHDDFFEMGGDSHLAASLLVAVQERLGRDIAPGCLLTAPTIAGLADRLLDSGEPPAIVCLREGASHTPPLFFLHGDLTLGGFYWRQAVEHFEADQPVYVLHPFETLSAETLDENSDRYLQLIRRVRPQGPYLLGGYCNGATIAFDMAQRLKAAGEEVPLLALVELYARNAALAPLFPVIRAVERVGFAHRDRQLRVLRGARDKLGAAAATAVRPSAAPLRRPPALDWKRRYAHYAPIVYGFMPATYAGRVTLLYGRDSHYFRADDVAHLRQRACRNLELHTIPGNHESVINEPGLGPLLQALIHSAAGAIMRR